MLHHIPARMKNTSWAAWQSKKGHTFHHTGSISSTCMCGILISPLRTQSRHTNTQYQRLKWPKAAGNQHIYIVLYIFIYINLKILWNISFALFFGFESSEIPPLGITFKMTILVNVLPKKIWLKHCCNVDSSGTIFLLYILHLILIPDLFLSLCWAYSENVPSCVLPSLILGLTLIGKTSPDQMRPANWVMFSVLFGSWKANDQ